MAAFAATTSRIKVGSGVINNWTRNAALIAATFLTLDDLAPERVLLGIGAWWDPLAKNVGIDRSKPLLAMREVVTVVRRLLAAEHVTFHGEFVNVTDIQLDVVHGRKGPRNVPIYIGATGMQMMELTGEIGDGVVLNYLVPPSYNAEAMEHLDKGAKKVGRRVDDLDRPQLVVCSMDRDRKKALDGARKLVTQYLAQQPHFAKAIGAGEDMVAQIKSKLGWPASEEQIEAAMQYVPDDMVQLVAAAGGPEECRAKVQEYIDGGATCPILYPLGPDVKLMIDTFAVA
jgi:5,10-methylenetetrahydromethanopterin reductase